MNTIDLLNRAKKNKDNEFYTRYQDVKFFVENSQLCEYFKDKIIYCPCDTEQSNIVKYLKDNQLKLGIKEIINTSDNYYSHEDLYDKCDVVFTNPPFTGIVKWLKWLNSRDIKYVSWFPMMGMYGLFDLKDINVLLYANANTIIGNKVFDEIHSLFEKPDGTQKGVVIFLISNDEYFDNLNYVGKSFKKSFNEVKDKLYMTNDGIYEASNSIYVPYDYYDPIYISLTAYMKARKYYELIEERPKGVTCRDGKSRPRMLVKINKSEVEKLINDRNGQ